MKHWERIEKACIPDPKGTLLRKECFRFRANPEMGDRERERDEEQSDRDQADRDAISCAGLDPLTKKVP